MSRPHPLCHDMVLSMQLAAGSWQKCCVTTKFPGKLGGLGSDRDSSVAIETCWPPYRDKECCITTRFGMGLGHLGRGREFPVATELACLMSR